jgi:hypothetical protein
MIRGALTGKTSNYKLLNTVSPLFIHVSMCSRDVELANTIPTLILAQINSYIGRNVWLGEGDRVLVSRSQ